MCPTLPYRLGLREKIKKLAPSILVPINYLKSKLIEKGFADESGHPKYIGKYLFLSDYEIVKEYNRILIKILTFYNIADNISGLGEIIYILEFSLAHTLSAKHRSTVSKIFKKYGKPIRVVKDSLDKIEFAKPKSLNKVYLKKKYGSRETAAPSLEILNIDDLLSATPPCLKTKAP